MLHRTVAGLLIVALCPLANAQEWGDLSLRIVYDAKTAPTPEKVGAAVGIPFCGGLGLTRDDLLVDPKDFGVANAFVYLVAQDGQKLPVHPDYAKTAKDEVKMANKGCAFVPKAVTVRTTQKFIGENPDPVGHNMKFDPFANVPFNLAIASGGKIEKIFDRPEQTPVEMSCGSHLWMKGLVLVRPDPYAAIANASGNVRLANVPVGKWSFRIWHERVGFVNKATIGGKPHEWTRGRIEWNIKPGANDLGDVLVMPAAFK